MTDNIKIIVNNDGFLTNKEYELLLKKYYELFVKMYGKDVADSLLSWFSPNNKSKLYNFILSFSQNQQMARKAIEQVKNNVGKNKLSFLMAYDNHNLMASARLRNLREKEASIPDVVFIEEEKRNHYWQLLMRFAEKYYTDLEYDKLYVEIPLYDRQLLDLCLSHGYVEDEEDRILKEETRTFLLNKKLERKR